MDNNQLKKMAASRIEKAQFFLAKFAKELLETPAYTLGWGGSAMSSAAELTVWQHILGCAEADCSLKVIVETLEDYMVGNAANPKYSSSMCANFMAQETLQAYANAYKMLKSELKQQQSVSKAA